MFRSEKGQSAIEFIGILPVLLLILLGFFDWFFYFSLMQEVESAARQGARQGTIAQQPVEKAIQQSKIYLKRRYPEDSIQVSATTARGTIEPGDELKVRVVVKYKAVARAVTFVPEYAQAVTIMTLEDVR